AGGTATVRGDASGRDKRHLRGVLRVWRTDRPPDLQLPDHAEVPGRRIGRHHQLEAVRQEPAARRFRPVQPAVVAAVPQLPAFESGDGGIFRPECTGTNAWRDLNTGITTQDVRGISGTASNTQDLYFVSQDTPPSSR